MRHIGTRIVEAKPMSEGAFIESTRRETGLNPEAYKIEGYEVFDPDEGTIVWVSKETFEKHYSPCDHATFSMALDAMLIGRRVRRLVWPEGCFAVRHFLDHMHYESHGGPYPLADCFGYKDEAGWVHPGWTPSNIDMLATDWVILPLPKDSDVP